jgi:flagellar hook-associated protein 1 FlgK
MTEILNIGVSALLAYQRSLATTGHNISNANTEGYNRQRVDLATRVPQQLGDSWVGTGVNVTQITRQYDEFLAGSVRSSLSATSEMETYYSNASRLDSLLADSDTGLDPAMQDFFSAISEVADDPTSIAARQVFLLEAQSMIDRFYDLNNEINESRRQLNNELTSLTSEITAIASNLADLNAKIITATGQPNDLLDERDLQINRLSELVSVSTVEQNDGAINVFIGTGQSLVTGTIYSTLSTAVGADGNNRDIVYTTQGASQVVTDFVTGGEVGGLLNFRSEILDNGQNMLGLVALGITDELNTQHQRGMDLDGNLGGLMFSAPQTSQGVVIQSSGATGTVGFAYDDMTDLTSSDYQLIYNGGTSYTLTRLSDDTTFALDSAVPASLTNDGFTLTLGGAPAAGETTYIRPTRAAAGFLSLNLTDPREVAAAAPIVTGASINNTGTTGAISAGEVTDITNSAFTTAANDLTPPIMIRFTAANTYSVYDNTVPGAPVLLEAGIAYTPGADVFPTPGALDYGYQIQITGAPATGDEFTVGYNTDGIGDNRNALAMGQIQNTNVLLGDSANGLSATTTIQGTYARLIADVGTKTNVAETNYNSQKAMLDFNETQFSSVSGVNLDEEAANLVRFQQAYQAAAQVISVSNTLFDSLIGAVRR